MGNRTILIYAATGVLVFGIGVMGFLWFTRDFGERSTEIKKEDGASLAAPENPGTVRVVSGENFTGFVLEYRDPGVFFPARLVLTATSTGGYSCVVKIANNSREDLVLRVGPYAPNIARGYPYEPILPGESGLYDLRYNHDELDFYNLKRPGAHVRVVYGPGCR